MATGKRQSRTAPTTYSSGTTYLNCQIFGLFVTRDFARAGFRRTVDLEISGQVIGAGQGIAPLLPPTPPDMRFSASGG